VLFIQEQITIDFKGFNEEFFIKMLIQLLVLDFHMSVEEPDIQETTGQKLLSIGVAVKAAVVKVNVSKFLL